jgi:hypothetical protein
MVVSTARITQEQFDALVSALSVATHDGMGGLVWSTPEWLLEWGVRMGYLKETTS